MTIYNNKTQPPTECFFSNRTLDTPVNEPATSILKIKDVPLCNEHAPESV